MKKLTIPFLMTLFAASPSFSLANTFNEKTYAENMDREDLPLNRLRDAEVAASLAATLKKVNALEIRAGALGALRARDAEVKDSGRLVPGFRGILDIIDSPLLAAPFAYLLFSLF